MNFVIYLNINVCGMERYKQKENYISASSKELLVHQCTSVIHTPAHEKKIVYYVLYMKKNSLSIIPLVSTVESQ